MGIKAIILATGQGTRLRPFTLCLPKVMLPLAGKPLLEHTLLLLRSHGITEVAINLNFFAGLISSYLGNGDRYGMEILYSCEERLLGTAAAVRRLKGYFSDTFVVVYGDVLTDLDISDIVQYHHSKGGIATIAVHEVSDATERGMVETTPEGRVTRFIEKPAPDEVNSSLANAGIYVLEPSIISHIPSECSCDFGKDLFPRLLELNAEIWAYPATSYVLDIGLPEAYEQAKKDIAEGRALHHANR